MWFDVIKINDDINDDIEGNWIEEARRILERSTTETPEQKEKWIENLRQESKQPVDMSDEVEMNASKCCEKTVQEFMKDEYNDIRELFPVWSKWVEDVGMNECDELKIQLEEINREGHPKRDPNKLSVQIQAIVDAENRSQGYTDIEIRNLIDAATELLDFWDECEEKSSNMGGT